MATKGKNYCVDCKQSRYDCRKYRYIGQARAVVYICKTHAAGRKDIEPAVNQKVGK